MLLAILLACGDNCSRDLIWKSGNTMVEIPDSCVNVQNTELSTVTETTADTHLRVTMNAFMTGNVLPGPAPDDPNARLMTDGTTTIRLLSGVVEPDGLVRDLGTLPDGELTVHGGLHPLRNGKHDFRVRNAWRGKSQKPKDRKALVLQDPGSVDTLFR